jgi:anti-sigma factor RsiW
MVTCRKIAEFLLEYLEGTLAPAQSREFARHLKACPTCEVYLRTYQDTILLARQAMCTSPDLLPPVPEELIKAILQAKSAASESTPTEAPPSSHNH